MSDILPIAPHTTHNTGQKGGNMDQYSMTEAARLLNVSLRTLTRWMRPPVGRAPIARERPWSDMRQRTISRAQLEQLAADHQRQIITSEETDPLARLEAVERALSERIEALEARVAALERKEEPGHPLQ